MTDGFFSDVSWKVYVAVSGMTLGAIALPMLLVAMLARNETIDRRAVFGCYIAARSPALLINNDAIQIIEPARRTFRYVAEASKTSYQLSVEPALALAPQTSGRYAFVAQRGTGYFWPLLPADGKNRNRVRHPEEYAGRFEVFAADGARIIYQRTRASEACHNFW